MDRNCDGVDGHCGDGVLQRRLAEECDTPEGDFCDACRFKVCGDNAVNTQFERCDDGNTTVGDGCSGCLPEVCGDGVVNFSVNEQCEPGQGSSCRADCTVAICGDSVVEGAERCDPDGAGCVNCQPVVCGDGVYNLAAEACDASDPSSPPCTALCASPVCGNGLVEPGEACDAMSSTCASCQANVCGDGFVNFPSETCEPSLAPSCLADCTSAQCGDGFVEGGEQCDSINFADVSPVSGCPGCQLARCGDGALFLNGEFCDDAAFGCDQCALVANTLNRTATLGAGDSVTTRVDAGCDATTFFVNVRGRSFAVHNTSSVAATIGVRTRCGPDVLDTVIAIYRGAYDPADPAARCERANDDTPLGLCSLLTARLAPDETVTLALWSYAGFFEMDPAVTFSLNVSSSQSFTVTP